MPLEFNHSVVDTGEVWNNALQQELGPLASNPLEGLEPAVRYLSSLMIKGYWGGSWTLCKIDTEEQASTYFPLWTSTNKTEVMVTSPVSGSTATLPVPVACAVTTILAISWILECAAAKNAATELLEPLHGNYERLNRMVYQWALETDETSPVVPSSEGSYVCRCSTVLN